MKKIFKLFSIFDIVLWCASIAIIISAFCIADSRDWYTLVAATVGVTTLMFIVKGSVVGQFLTVAFSALYGAVSYFFGYYGEMATYLGLSTPAAIASIVSWMRHKYKDTAEVEIAKVGAKRLAFVAGFAAIVSIAFYFVLDALDTTNLAISTISVVTSVFAAALTYLRSPLYGLAYATNDAVLIVMWSLATVADTAYAPMIVCFSLFSVYDVYGFFNWSTMRKRQREEN